jgi:NCK-associated protein 1
MDANQCQLDITLNYDLTAGFLNLISNFVALMILLGRVDDRKAILALYNAAYDLTNGKSEQSFPRLGQMILDYENPLRKLSEDFSPINRVSF